MTRVCRTLEETAAAGWDDGADDRPVDQAELTQLAALWHAAEAARDAA